LELISTVRFDLEEGPVVDFSFPSQNFSEDFIKKLAYPAFPDSYTLLCDDKMFFSFMMKAKPGDRTGRIYTFEDHEKFLESQKEQEKRVGNEEEGENEEDSQKIIEDYNKTKKKEIIQGWFM
jgi:hypothetical protein